MQITYYVDRASAIRNGHNDHGQREREVDVSALSQEDRDLLAAVTDYQGHATKVTAGGQVVPIRAAAPTPTALMAAIRAANAEAAELTAKRRAKEDEELALAERVDAAALAGKRLRKSHSGVYDQWEPDQSGAHLIYARTREAELVTRNSPAWAAWLEEIAATNAAAKAAYEAECAERVRASAAVKARREAEEAAAKDRLAAWVRANGSELARLRLEDGYDCWVSVARHEYAEAAGARVVAGLGLTAAETPDGYEHDESEERECPLVHEIKALRAAREAAAKEPADHPVGVELLLSVYKPTEDEDDYDTGEDAEPLKRCELRVTVDGLPGGSIDVDFVFPTK